MVIAVPGIAAAEYVVATNVSRFSPGTTALHVLQTAIAATHSSRVEPWPGFPLRRESVEGLVEWRATAHRKARTGRPPQRSVGRRVRGTRPASTNSWGEPDSGVICPHGHVGVIHLVEPSFDFQFHATPSEVLCFGDSPRL